MQLEQMLDRVREALLSGDFAALSGIDEQIGTLVDTLPRYDRLTVERLRQKAGRNELLLSASARGLRSARRRLADIGSALTLTTYDMHGKRAAITNPEATVPHRV